MPEDTHTQGLEELIAAAALDEEVAAAVAVKDLNSLRALGVDLSAVEQEIFLATEVGLLQRLSDQVRQRVTAASKRAFLAGAATAGGVLAASGLGGCARKTPVVYAGVRADDRPPDSTSPPPDAGTNSARPRPRPRPAPRPRDYPAPTGVRPDRPGSKPNR